MSATKRGERGVMVAANAGIPRTRLSTEEKIEVAKKICNRFATGRYTLASCCKKYEISLSAFTAWASPSRDLTAMLLDGQSLPPLAIVEVHNMYKEAKEMATFNYKDTLMQAARQGLMDKVSTREVEEVMEKHELDKDMYIEDTNGNKVLNPNFGKMKLVERRVKVQSVAPDTAAIVFALTNTDGNNFKDRKFVDAKVDTTDTTGLSRLSADELKQKRLDIQARLERVKNIKEDDYIEYETVPDNE